MSLRVRPAHGDDFRAIYQMAKLTGGGFTNLPADRATLVAKLARSDESFNREADEQAGDLYVFVLEDVKTGQIRGTCQVFGQVGVIQPFYSYHLSTLTQSSPELGKTFRNQTLTLTTDLEGASEVGGLFLHPEVRAGGSFETGGGTNPRDPPGIDDHRRVRRRRAASAIDQSKAFKHSNVGSRRGHCLGSHRGRGREGQAQQKRKRYRAIQRPRFAADLTHPHLGSFFRECINRNGVVICR